VYLYCVLGGYDTLSFVVDGLQLPISGMNNSYSGGSCSRSKGSSSCCSSSSSSSCCCCCDRLYHEAHRSEGPPRGKDVQKVG